MSVHLPSPVKFRTDINGLRAWAVISVLLFHFSLIGLPGGYAGVDIFFVISGYLMTAIIVGGYLKGQFSISNFYMARVRRILPALIAVILFLLVIGWFWMPTVTYKSLATQSIYSLVFSSNFFFWRTTGYFDGGAPYKWLLHTWSLAVEAQFYILYPLFIAFIWKLFSSIKAVTWAVVIALIISLIINLMITNWFDQSVAFYLLPARGWELLAGGLVYLITKQISLRGSLLTVLYWLGWFLILITFSLNNELTWPGYWSILPVLGASFIILANKENNWLTRNSFAQWIGDRSYSLYLWHWPLIVALFFFDKQFDVFWVTSLFMLSLIFAHLSYQFIEVPTRKYLSAKSLKREAFYLFVILFTIVMAAQYIKNANFNDRFNPKVDGIMSEMGNNFRGVSGCWMNQYFTTSDLNKAQACTFNKGNSTMAVVGDSHSGSVLSSVIHSTNDQIIFYGATACSFAAFRSHETVGKAHKCALFDDRLLELLLTNQQISSVLIINRFNELLSGGRSNSEMFIPRNGDSRVESIKAAFEKTIAALVRGGKTVYIMTPIPEMNDKVPLYMARNIIINDVLEDYVIPKGNYELRSKVALDFFDYLSHKYHVQLIKAQNVFCDQKFCYGSHDKRPYYFDDNHLSEYGNKLLIPELKAAFDSHQ